MKTLLRALLALTLILTPSLAFAVANTAPLFSLTPSTDPGKTIAAANTAKDGTGTVVTLFTAGANGGRCERVIWQPIGTNVATAGRLFINNGGSNATPANNTYYSDVTLAASTLSEVASMPSTTMQIDLVLPASYKLNITIGTAVAAGYAVTALCGSY